VSSSSARSADFCTLPSAVRGTASSSSVRLGCLKRASRCVKLASRPRQIDHWPRVRHQHQHRHLAPARVGQAHHRGLGHAGPGAGDVLDLGGVDVLAAGDQHVLAAAHHRHPAIGIGTGQVAGGVPAVDEAGARRLAVVAAHQVGRTQLDLAHCAGSHRRAVGPGQLQLHARRRRPVLPTCASASSGASAMENGPVSVLPYTWAMGTPRAWKASISATGTI
jgi:hypothetical protein